MHKQLLAAKLTAVHTSSLIFSCMCVWHSISQWSVVNVVMIDVWAMKLSVLLMVQCCGCRRRWMQRGWRRVFVWSQGDVSEHSRVLRLSTTHWLWTRLPAQRLHQQLWRSVIRWGTFESFRLTLLSILVNIIIILPKQFSISLGFCDLFRSYVIGNICHMSYVIGNLMVVSPFCDIIIQQTKPTSMSKFSIWVTREETTV